MKKEKGTKKIRLNNNKVISKKRTVKNENAITKTKDLSIKEINKHFFGNLFNDNPSQTSQLLNNTQNKQMLY